MGIGQRRFKDAEGQQSRNALYSLSIYDRKPGFTKN